MERKVNIVPGEAPESDDEVAYHVTGTTPLHGTAIEGEAPESDSSTSDTDDIDDGVRPAGSVGSISSATSALSLLSPTSEASKTVRVSNSREDIKYTSLLHKKLRERNASLRRSVDDFVHHTVGAAARDLNSIDQHLLKSQMTLQEAATSLRLLQSNLSHIHSKLSSITSVMHLPAMNLSSL